MVLPLLNNTPPQCGAKLRQCLVWGLLLTGTNSITLRAELFFLNDGEPRQTHIQYMGGPMVMKFGTNRPHVRHIYLHHSLCSDKMSVQHFRLLSVKKAMKEFSICQKSIQEITEHLKMFGVFILF